MIYSINMHTTVYQFWRFVYHHEQSVIDHYTRSSLYTRSFCTGIKLYVGHFLWPRVFVCRLVLQGTLHNNLLCRPVTQKLLFFAFYSSRSNDLNRHLSVRPCPFVSAWNQNITAATIDASSGHFLDCDSTWFIWYLFLCMDSYIYIFMYLYHGKKCFIDICNLLSHR